MPWLTRDCFAAVALRFPRARLFSSVAGSPAARASPLCGGLPRGGRDPPPHDATATTAIPQRRSKDRRFIVRALPEFNGRTSRAADRVETRPADAHRTAAAAARWGWFLG